MKTAKRRRSRAFRRFEGLVLSSGTVERAQAALRRAGLERWHLAPLGQNSTLLFASPPPATKVGTGAGWDLVYKLRTDRDIDHVEPAFETVGLDEPAADATPTRSIRGSGSSKRHLPESNPHDWVIRMCRVREAWASTTSPPGHGVLLAHPDTGYSDHPELGTAALRLDLGYDFFDDDVDPRDPLKGGSEGHGTATASVIVSSDDPGIIGAAPGAKIVPLRMDNDVIHFSWRRLCAALYWAAANKLPVASMSLGGPWGGSALEDAVRHATDNGVILISAAGNHWGSVVYPACLPEVIAIAACNAVSMPWSGSSRGPEVDITAPGESVWRAKASKPGRFEIERSFGTSYATATTAGICVLWLARHGGFDALAARYGRAGVGGVFKEALLSSARKPGGWDPSTMGAGIVDAKALLDVPLPQTAPARGIRTLSRLRRAPTGWQRIEAFFPKAAPERVHSVVLSLMESGARAPSKTTRDISMVFDELHFHIATDPALREAIGERLAAGRGVRSGRNARIAFSEASTQLKRVLAH